MFTGCQSSSLLNLAFITLMQERGFWRNLLMPQTTFEERRCAQKGISHDAFLAATLNIGYL